MGKRLTDGSTNNTINHLTIKNATIGMLVQNNDGTTLSIKNTQIYDCSNYGILAQTAKIEGENIVINAGLASLSCSTDGDYNLPTLHSIITGIARRKSPYLLITSVSEPFLRLRI
jgi:hypothetical protein